MLAAEIAIGLLSLVIFMMVVCALVAIGSDVEFAAVPSCFTIVVCIIAIVVIQDLQKQQKPSPCVKQSSYDVTARKAGA